MQFVVEAYDDELSEWIVLDAQTSITNWQPTTKNEFKINNNKSYLKYRINVTSSVGGSAIVIGELEMMETISNPVVNILKVVLEPEEELQLSVEDDLEENAMLTWTSSVNEVASVDANGVVTALKPGNTVITATSEDGEYTDTISVLVVEKARDYRLSVDLRVGKFCRLTVDDFTETTEVTWVSMDPSVAIVSSKGKLTAVSTGLTLVTATNEQGKVIGQMYIRVRI